MADIRMDSSSSLTRGDLIPEFKIPAEISLANQLRGPFKDVLRIIGRIFAVILRKVKPDSTESMKEFGYQVKLLQSLMYYRLIGSPEDGIMRDHYMKQTWIREKRLLNLLKTLKDEYAALDEKKEIKLSTLNETIRNLMGQIDNAYLHTHQEINKTIADYTKMELVTTKSADQTLQELHGELRKCVAVASVMRARFAAAEEELQKKKRKIEAELEAVIAQYDTEMFARQAQLDALVEEEEANKSQLTEIENELKKIELKFSAMQDELRAKENLKRKKKKKKGKGSKGKKKKKGSGRRKGKGKSKSKSRKTRGRSKGKKKKKRSKKKKGASGESDTGDEFEGDDSEAEETGEKKRKKKSKKKSKEGSKGKGGGAKGSKQGKGRSKGGKSSKKKKVTASPSKSATSDEEYEDLELGDLVTEEDEEEDIPIIRTVKSRRSSKSSQRSTTTRASSMPKRRKKKSKKKRKSKKKKAKKPKKAKDAPKTSQQVEAQGTKPEEETAVETEGDFNEPPTPPELNLSVADFNMDKERESKGESNKA